MTTPAWLKGHLAQQPHRLEEPPEQPADSGPVRAVRAVAARITAVERDLADARAALATAEAELSVMRQPALVPDAYTMEQVAQTLGLSRSTVAEMLRRHEIHSVKLGGCRRVFRADIDAYIARVRGASA
jgi:excisionase family DNA binding protein